MQTSDELANPQAFTPEAAAESFTLTPEMQEMMRQWSQRKPTSRHAAARAERAKARIAKRKKKR